MREKSRIFKQVHNLLIIELVGKDVPLLYLVSVECIPVNEIEFSSVNTHRVCQGLK